MPEFLNNRSVWLLSLAPLMVLIARFCKVMVLLSTEALAFPPASIMSMPHVMWGELLRNIMF